MTNRLQAWLRNRRRKEEQFRQAVRAQNVATVSERAQLGDAELIAQAPGFPGPGYEMEMSRRLKVAITNLTGEIVRFLESSDRASNRIFWLTVFVAVLTAALVALTVVLAVKS